eukprot:9473777-Pyramimonas_sp.AAC.1
MAAPTFFPAAAVGWWGVDSVPPASRPHALRAPCLWGAWQSPPRAAGTMATAKDSGNDDDDDGDDDHDDDDDDDDGGGGDGDDQGGGKMGAPHVFPPAACPTSPRSPRPNAGVGTPRRGGKMAAPAIFPAAAVLPARSLEESTHADKQRSKATGALSSPRPKPPQS